MILTLMSNSQGNFWRGMCSHLQTHQRTTELPNANDVDGAQQSQGRTLDCPFILWPVMPLIWHQNAPRWLFVFVYACACRCVSCIILLCGTLYDTLCMTFNIALAAILWLSCPLKITKSNGMFFQRTIPQIQ